AMQNQPGDFFAASQIWLNAMAILGGILGESAFTAFFRDLISPHYQGAHLETASFSLSFFVVTSLYILFSDLIPKRLALVAPEKFACAIIRPLTILVLVIKPISNIFNAAANGLFRLFGIKINQIDEIT